MSISDELMWKYWTLLTDLKQSEIAAMRSEVASGALHPMEAKKRLARTIAAGFHGESAAESAAENWSRMFQQKEVAGDLEEVAVAYVDVAGKVKGELLIRKLLVQVGLAASVTEANRKLAENAVHWSGDVTGKMRVYLTKPRGRVVVRVGKRAKIAIIS
jgi:tyrosyl-tRNA synthetase